MVYELFKLVANYRVMSNQKMTLKSSAEEFRLL